MAEVTRGTWVSTVTGTLDASFALSEEERYVVDVTVNRLFERLAIPERSVPKRTPAAVAAEAEGGLFSTNVAGSRQAGVVRNARAVRAGDVVVTLEAWREMLVAMVYSSYPDLLPEETVLLTQTFDAILLAIGVPNRAPINVPDDVVRTHLQGA